MRSARSDPKFSIAMISGRECQQVQPRDKRTVTLWCPPDIRHLRTVPAMDPMLDPRPHLFAAGNAVRLDVLFEVRDAKQSSSTD